MGVILTNHLRPSWEPILQVLHINYETTIYKPWKGHLEGKYPQVLGTYQPMGAHPPSIRDYQRLAKNAMKLQTHWNKRGGKLHL